MGNFSNDSWRGRMQALDECGDDFAAIRKLINEEQKTHKRTRFALRMYGRFTDVRRKAEEAALARGEQLK